MDGFGIDVELALFEGGRRLLESMARGAALTSVLDEMCRLVEHVADGCVCTVLLVEPGGARMQIGAAPGLPDTYNRFLSGRPARAEFGPCGMAAVIREQVIVDDIESDDRWTAEGWNSLALAHGLRACWSTPILSPAGVALGTFAIYWTTPERPGRAHQHAIYQMTHIAAVAIERERTAAALASAGHLTTGHTANPQNPSAPSDAQVLRDCYKTLTAREREVMTWVVAGLPNKRICAELGTAEITIKIHRGRVMRKMRAESLPELVRMAARLDLPLPRRRSD